MFRGRQSVHHYYCCALPDVLNEALKAFVRTLDSHTLEDLMLKPRDFAAISGKLPCVDRGFSIHTATDFDIRVPLQKPFTRTIRYITNISL